MAWEAVSEGQSSYPSLGEMAAGHAVCLNQLWDRPENTLVLKLGLAFQLCYFILQALFLLNDTVSP